VGWNPHRVNALPKPAKPVRRRNEDVMKRIMSLIAVLALGVTLLLPPAFAQTTQPQAGQGQTKATPKRARSPAQLRNDQIMRDCGAEWRASKAAGKTGTQTWRGFLGECRKRKSA
jgi:hypothetical protein